MLFNTENIFEQKNPDNKSFTFPGYHDERSFYRRANVSEEDAKKGLDYSTTLFWNPEVQIRNKAFSIKFKTADLPGRHCIYIQGLTDEGIPFVRKKYFVVE